VSCAGPSDALARASALAALGHRGRLPRGAAAALSEAVAGDPDARVRSVALGALSRAAAPGRALRAWRGATRDGDAGVRRRAAELAPGLARRGSVPTAPLVTLLADADVTVVEAAAWSLGELGDSSSETVGALTAVTTGHADPLAREAAVAALGAIADPGGLDAVLAACGDVATVRRRAVLALAPFDGPGVDAALERALGDRDWQVRQAAEDLLEAERAGGQ
jgi:HEAT repeat protein